MHVRLTADPVIFTAPRVGRIATNNKRGTAIRHRTQSIQWLKRR